MISPNDIVTVEIFRSHVNPQDNPFIGVVKDGDLQKMVVVFDKHDPASKTLEIGRLARVTVLKVLPKCLIGRFNEYG